MRPARESEPQKSSKLFLWTCLSRERTMAQPSQHKYVNEPFTYTKFERKNLTKIMDGFGS